MSSIGVLSNMPSLPTSMFASLIPSTSKTDIPIGLDLMGEHVLNARLRPMVP